MKSLRIILPAILILIVTFSAFFPCLQNGFTNWDDDKYVTQNVVIQNLSLHNIVWISSTFFSATYLPVTMLSYMIDYQLTRQDPFGYHLTNLIFHLMNSLLVFWLVWLLSRNMLVSFIAAILFGVHPLHVESVAWISGRKDVLYSYFFLLAMICYCYYLQSRKTGKAYWLSLVFFILSLLSKAMAITLPLLLLLADYLRERRLDYKMVADKIPFLFFAICFGVLGFYGQGDALRIEPWLSCWGKFLIASYAVIFYISKLLLPVGLSCLYPYSGIKDISIYLLSLASCLVIVILMIRSVHHTRKVVFGVLFFLITLLPVLQFVPMGSAIVADRYAYMASTGLFYLIAEMVAWAYKKAAEKSRYFSLLLIAFFLIPMIGGLSVLTWNRCLVWKDGIVLFSDALSKHPNLSWGYNQRGVLFQERRDYAAALRDFKAQLLYAPLDVVAYLNLGNLYNAMGKSVEAIAVLKQGLNMGTEPGVLYFTLATTYSKLGDEDAAISCYKKALELEPNNAAASYSLGMLYKKMGKKDDAVRMLSRTTEIAPDFMLAYLPLGQLYKDAGQKAEHFALYQQIVAHDAPFYDAYYAVGSFYQDAGQNREAIPLFQKAIELNAASVEANASLGAAYIAIGKNKDAIVWLKKALSINPKLAVAHNNIAVAYYYQKQYDLAIEHCDRAVELGYKATPELLGLLKRFRK